MVELKSSGGKAFVSFIEVGHVFQSGHVFETGSDRGPAGSFASCTPTVAPWAVPNVHTSCSRPGGTFGT